MTFQLGQFPVFQTIILIFSLMSPKNSYHFIMAACFLDQRLSHGVFWIPVNHKNH